MKKSVLRFTVYALLYILSAISTLNAEVLVRISEEENVHQIAKAGGQLWLLTESGAYRVTGNDITSVLSGVSVFTIAELDNGQLWIGSRKGLYLVNGDEATPILTDTFRDKPVGNIYQTEGGIWLGSSDGLFFLGRNDLAPSKVLRDWVNVITEIDGDVWVGTKRNAYRMTSSNLPDEDEGVLPSSEKSEVVNIIKAGGSIWITTLHPFSYGFGLCFRFSGSGPKKVLADQEVVSVAEVFDEIWVSTTDGAVQLPGKKFLARRTFAARQQVNAVYGFKDQIWIGTTKRVYRLVGDTDLNTVTVGSLNVRGFHEFEGNLWLRTEMGAFRLDEGVEIYARLNTSFSILGREFLLGSTAQIKEIRYDYKGVNPYGTSIEPEFKAILAKDQKELERLLSGEKFSSIETLERSISAGRSELHLVVRDDSGNETLLPPVHIFMLDKLTIVAILLILAVPSILAYRKRLFFKNLHQGVGHEVDSTLNQRIDEALTQKINIVRSGRRFVVDQRYDYQEILGRGAVGYVFRAVDSELGRSVALKFLPAGNYTDTEELFRQEAAVMANLNHQNIVTVFDFGRYEGEFFIVMEYVEGDNFNRCLESDIRACMREVKSIFSQIAEALAHAHKAGVIHCDVKPSNVMVREDGVVKLMDFGIAKLLSSLSQATTGLGTPVYMAPEQILREMVDARSDIYSLGIMLYQVAAGGRPPFIGNSQSVLRQHLTKRPERPSTFNPTIVSQLDELILLCIEKDPARRPDDIRQVAHRLEAIDPLFLA